MNEQTAEGHEGYERSERQSGREAEKEGEWEHRSKVHVRYAAHIMQSYKMLHD